MGSYSHGSWPTRDSEAMTWPHSGERASSAPGPITSTRMSPSSAGDRRRVAAPCTAKIARNRGRASDGATMNSASPDSVASARPLGLAVVGAGYWGPNLIRSSAVSGRFEPRWVCDADPVRAERAAARSGMARPTTDLDVVLADPTVDAVAVATPAWTHSTVADAALRAGKHVLVEKPLATPSAEGRHLVELAEATGRVLMCDHTYCYTPAVQAIRDMVGSGEVGELLFIDSVRVNLGLIQPDVDVIWDLAPHDLAILDAILPDGCKPRTVAAHGAAPGGAGLACLAHLNLDLPGGLPVALNLNWLSPVKV